MIRLLVSIRWNAAVVPLALAGLMTTAMAPVSVAQDDSKPAETPAQEEQVQPDPFEVPDGTPQELKAFIQKMATMRVPAKTREEMVEQQKKRLAAVVTAAEKIIAAEPDEETNVFAHENLYGALESFVRMEPERAEQLAELSAKLESSPIPALARLPVASRLRQSIQTAPRMAPEDLEALAQDVLAFVEKYGMDPVGMSMASTLGRYMGYAGATEAGAVFYDRIGAIMEKSDDPLIADRSRRMFGAARMLRLPGKPIEVSGDTVDGSQFDWASYRGKVVLVDFWASWCGPCLAELPNMKQNLAKYGDKGFTILGINIDEKREAFEKCVTDKEITWTNLVGNPEAGIGWNHPMATYYGISAIPTAILVDQQGNVVSLRARGAELDKLLVDLLGPVETEGTEGADAPAETDK